MQTLPPPQPAGRGNETTPDCSMQRRKFDSFGILSGINVPAWKGKTEVLDYRDKANKTGEVAHGHSSKTCRSDLLSQV